MGTQPTPAGAQLRLSDIQYDVTNMVDLEIEAALIGIVGGFDVGTAIEVRGDSEVLEQSPWLIFQFDRILFDPISQSGETLLIGFESARKTEKETDRFRFTGVQAIAVLSQKN